MSSNSPDKNSPPDSPALPPAAEQDKPSEPIKQNVAKSMDPSETPPAKSGAPAQSPSPKSAGFRYHKRVTVRTDGRTSPTAVMAKIKEDDHKAHITLSNIDQLDPAEIAKRAGLKPNSKAKWRIRLRQTRRVTRNGKTYSETKIAYRDSDGRKDPIVTEVVPEEPQATDQKQQQQQDSPQIGCNECGMPPGECKCVSKSEKSTK